MDDDDKVVREGTVSLIAGQPDLECVGAFETAEIFMQEIKVIRPRVVLMDIELPGNSGIMCIYEKLHVHTRTDAVNRLRDS